jgi:hypothetical protein
MPNQGDSLLAESSLNLKHLNLKIRSAAHEKRKNEKDPDHPDPSLFLALFVVLIANGKMVLWSRFLPSASWPRLFSGGSIAAICADEHRDDPDGLDIAQMEDQDGQSSRMVEVRPLCLGRLAVSMASMLALKRLRGVNFPILPSCGRFHPGDLALPSSVFHNLLCPFGAVQKIFAKKPVFSIESTRTNVSAANLRKSLPFRGDQGNGDGSQGACTRQYLSSMYKLSASVPQIRHILC